MSYTASKPADGIVDSLHLSDEQYAAIVADLSNAGAHFEGEEQRQSPRRPYGADAILVWEIAQEESSAVRYLVRCRNISSGGAAFLHGAYVHPGTPCTLTLLKRDRSGIRFGATIARCQHVAGHVHDIGVQFDELLEEQVLPFEDSDVEAQE